MAVQPSDSGTNQNPADAPIEIAGGGDCGAVIRAKDWSANPLGDIQSWPHNFRTALGIVLDSAQPMFIAWGPQLSLLYNDAFRSTLAAAKHPAAIGQSVRDSLSENWNVLEPTISQVMSTGRAISLADQKIFVHRDGAAREIAAMISCSAIRDASQNVGGVIITCVEHVDRKAFDRELEAFRLENEQQLKTNEDRLRLATQTGKVGVWEWDVDANRVTWSESLYAIHGISPTQFDGTVEGFSKLVHPEDRDAVAAVLLRTMSSDDNYETEFRALRPDGSIVWLYTHAIVQRANGRAVKLSGATVDITSRKRAEELRANLAAIVECSEDAIISKTLDGTIRSWNAGAERLFGHTAAEAIGKPITIIVPSDRLAEERSILDRLRRGQRIEHFETRRITKTGQLIDISLTVSPIRDSTGRIIGASKTARNVTDRKNAETALRLAREQLETVTDTMAAAVARCSRDLRIVWASRGYAEWARQSQEALVNKSLLDVLGKEALDAAMPYINRTLAGETVDFEMRVNMKNRGMRWVNAIYTPLHDALGNVDGWVAVVSDVTQNREMEETLREADRRKDEFIATLAHELRNPLAPLRNGLQMLRANPAGDAMTESAREMMDRQLSQMVRLIDDLLDVSRISRGTIELRRENIDLALIVQNAADTSRPLIEQNHHAFEIEMPPEKVTVNADPTRLAQIIANLLNNSAKYTNANGKIRLAVSVKDKDVTFSVSDNGIGIAAEMLPKVFDMFTQVRDSHDRTQGGLGIGLSIVRKLAEMHGGTITARSDGAGKGSEFVVRLPIVVASPQRTESKPKLDEFAKSANPMRILIVDDNVDSADSLLRLMKIKGHTAKTANDGMTGIEIAKEFSPEVVVLDIGLPGLNGYQVAKKLRASPGGENMTLIALTGWGQDEDRRLSKEAGFDHHLVKPVDFQKLLDLFAPAAATAE